MQAYQIDAFTNADQLSQTGHASNGLAMYSSTTDIPGAASGRLPPQANVGHTHSHFNILSLHIGKNQSQLSERKVISTHFSLPIPKLRSDINLLGQKNFIKHFQLIKSYNFISYYNTQK